MRIIAVAFAALLLTACGAGDNGTTLSDLKGRVVFVNYWAEWCKPCREEIPELNEFQRRHPEAVAVVGVNYDGATGEELARQEQALAIEFANLSRDPRAQRGIAAPAGLPETLVFDREGHLRAVLKGPQTLDSLEGALAKVGDKEEAAQ